MRVAGETVGVGAPTLPEIEGEKSESALAQVSPRPPPESQEIRSGRGWGEGRGGAAFRPLLQGSRCTPQFRTPRTECRPPTPPPRRRPAPRTHPGAGFPRPSLAGFPRAPRAMETAAGGRGAGRGLEGAAREGAGGKLPPGFVGVGYGLRRGELRVSSPRVEVDTASSAMRDEV